MKKNYVIITLLSIFVLLFAVGCGKQLKPTNVESNVESGNVESKDNFIKISLTSADLSLNEEIVLDVFVNPSDMKPQWSSSDTSVAMVDDKGNVKAVGVGTATIEASLGEYERSFCSITVTSVKKIAYNFALNKKSLKLSANDNYRLGYVLFMGDKKSEKVPLLWNSSDSSVAEITDDGVIVPKKYGYATITATYTADDGKKYVSSCEVYVSENYDISVMNFNDIKEVLPGAKFNFEVGVYDLDGNAISVKKTDLAFSSSNDKIIAYEDGKFIAKNCGETNLTVAYRGSETTCRVKVKGADAGLFTVLRGGNGVTVSNGENGFIVYSSTYNETNYAVIKGEKWRDLLSFAEENGYARLIMKIYGVNGVCILCPNGSNNLLFEDSGYDFVLSGRCTPDDPVVGCADISSLKNYFYLAIGMNGKGSFEFAISFE